MDENLIKLCAEVRKECSAMSREDRQRLLKFALSFTDKEDCPEFQKDQLETKSKNL